MNYILAFLQAAEEAPDMTWNYIILGILIVLAIVLGIAVMKKRQGA